MRRPWRHLQEVMENPEMTGMFKGLHRFNLDDYIKVQSRVTTCHLEFFVKQYCENAGGLEYRDKGGHCFSFKPSEKLAELASVAREKSHPYPDAESELTKRVSNATVDKEVAQKGARLLRFGDPVFEAMVEHVQYRDFSAVASLDMPANLLGWVFPRQQGTWLLFELQVARTEGQRSLVLRRELASFVVPIGSDVAESKPELVEHVIEATQGPLGVDVEDVRRAYKVGRHAADALLGKILGEVRAEYPDPDNIAGVPVSDLAIAWVRAV